MGVGKSAELYVADQPSKSQANIPGRIAAGIDAPRLSNAEETGQMNKKHNRNKAIFFVAVVALLLLFGELALGGGKPNGVASGNQWTGGAGLMWLTVFLAGIFCLLLDRMLFNKKW